MRHPLVARIDQLSTDRWARRGLRTLLRALWLGMSLACVGLAGNLLWSWPLRLDLLGGLVLASLGFGAIALLRPRLAPRVAARSLDRRFGLHEQLSTALEVAATQPPPESVAGRLLAEATGTTAHLRRYIATRQRPPWVEVTTTTSLALVLLGMLVLIGLRSGTFSASPLLLPDLAGPLSEQSPPNEPPAQPPGSQQGAQGGNAQGQQQGDSQGQQGGGQGQGSGQSQGGQPDAGAQQALDAIADALRDQSATRPAADALDRGDAAGAASSLRELADQASQLGEQTRDEIAQSLRDAARNVQQSNPGLADQLRNSADGLERGGNAAAQALDNLARAVEQQGQGGAQGGQQGQQGGQGGQGQGSGGQGNAPGGEQRDRPSDRLNAPGVPLELENQGQGTVPAQGDRPPDAAVSGSGSGFTPRGDARDSGTVQAGDDPLRIPAEDRDVVQGYFSPQN